MEQRRVWKKAWPSLPQEIKDEYLAHKSSGVKGSIKKCYAIVNSVVSRSVQYKDNVQIDRKTFERFRKVVKHTKHEEGRRGYTKTQMVGTGMLGSEQVLWDTYNDK
jgi:hypothetical protein